jgi:hypothetical protein
MLIAQKMINRALSKPLTAVAMAVRRSMLVAI